MSEMAYPYESTPPSSGPYYLVPLPLVLPADLEKWLDSFASTPKYLLPTQMSLFDTSKVPGPVDPRLFPLDVLDPFLLDCVCWHLTSAGPF
jgi:hypothetical protein